MTSVIRLLPKRKIPRHTEEYSKVVAKVSTRRFLHAFRVVLMAAALASMLYSVFFRQPFVHTFIVNALCVSLVVVLYKLVLRTEFPRSASAALEIVDGVLNTNNLIVFAGFLLSAEVYFRLALVPGLPSYYTQKVQSQSVPAGIPKSLALHRKNLWYVVNEEYYYLSSFITVFTISYALLFVYCKKCVLDIQDEERGMHPFNRLVRRSSKVNKQLLAALASVVVYPLFYFTVVRPLFITPLKLYGIVELSGFELKFLIKPIAILPLVIDWSFGYECFMAYLTLGPVYRGSPLSSTVSDPNGCLLTGLNSNYQSLAGILAWDELSMISNKFADRRKSIFKDVDQDRVAWLSINASFKALLKNQIASLDSKKQGKNEGKNEDKNETKPGSNSTSGQLEKHGEKHGEKTCEKHSENQGNGANKNDKKSRKPKPIPSDQLLLSSDIMAIQKEQDSVTVHPEKESLYKPVSYIEKRLYELIRRLETDSDKKVEFAQRVFRKYARIVLVHARKAYIAFFQSRLGVPFIVTFDRDLYTHLKHLRTTKYALQAVTSLVAHSIHEDEYGYVQESVGGILEDIDTLLTVLKNRLNHPHDHVPALAKPVKELNNHASSTQIGQEQASKLMAELETSFDEISTLFKPYFGNMKIPEKVIKRVQL